MNFCKNKKCRTCLKPSLNLTLLSTKPKMLKINKTYMDLLKFVANIEIIAEDTNPGGNMTPPGICCSCSKRIRDSYTFIKHVRDCNKQFLMSSDEAKKEVQERNKTTIDVVTNKECEEQHEIKQELDTFEDTYSLTQPIKLETVQDTCCSTSNENFNQFPQPDSTESDAQQSDGKDATGIDAIKSESDSTDTWKDLLPVCILYEAAFTEDKINANSDPCTKAEKCTYNPLDSNEANGAKENDKPDSNEAIEVREGEITDNNEANEVEEEEDVEEEETPELEIDEKTLPVRCDECERVFPNSMQLKRHRKDTHIPDELKIQCPSCPIKFSRRYNMYAHMRTYHKGETVREQQIKPRKLTKPEVCDKCNRAYSDKYTLMAHIKRKHGPDIKPKKEKEKKPRKVYLCTLCGLTCRRQSDLDIHYRRHTGDKPFNCDFCSRGYARLYDLQVHRRIHTGETPFKCTICEKAFKRSNKLKNHIRTHTNERPYKCKQCEKAYKQSNDLNVHMRTHTGERPYKCNVCNSTFTQSSSLKLHQRKTKHLEMSNQETELHDYLHIYNSYN